MRILRPMQPAKHVWTLARHAAPPVACAAAHWLKQKSNWPPPSAPFCTHAFPRLKRSPKQAFAVPPHAAHESVADKAADRGHPVNMIEFSGRIAASTT